ncbi:DUF2963 domain-containing protein [Candidatus Phytoplasma sp. AldY-WA1]|uniref:DUF2963 domain-containing protein n=1 Tax=Candidatus Phytoplasma sp. AldY-WA1 TaxID=2852100 RepID=UPI00254E16E8|nr:DUF2963 domain-containing protein [Candidatus Phytoplasma sp. AldY-WA1]
MWGQFVIRSNPETHLIYHDKLHGKIIKITTYNPDRTINYIEEFNEDEKLIKKTHYYF